MPAVRYEVYRKDNGEVLYGHGGPDPHWDKYKDDCERVAAEVKERYGIECGVRQWERERRSIQ